MAKMITEKTLADGGHDLETIDKAANTVGWVDPRYGKKFRSVPLIAIEKAENNMFQPFLTEAELLAYVPVLVPTVAKALDTHKVWFYGLDPKATEIDQKPKWHDTGLSELDQANKYSETLNSKNGIVTGIDSAQVEFAVTDEQGNTPLAVLKDSTTLTKKIKSESVESKTTNTAGIEILEIETSEFEVAYTDDNGVVVFGIKKDGSIFPELSTKPIYLARNIKLQMSDWIHSFLYGQSLANGVGTGSVVSASQPYSNICMKSGVYPRPQDTEYYDSSDVKPLVEERSISGSSQIETPTSGFLNKLSANFESVNKNYVFFGNAGGQSGARIEQISKGSSYYDSQLQLIRDAMKLAQERNLSYSVHFIAWKQGEASQSNKTVKEYYDLFLKFKDDISADIKSITGQNFEPILLTYQVASQLWSKSTQIPIARAQWLASRDRGDIMMSHSMYAMSYAPDYLHLSAGASEQCGRWFGNAAFHVYQEQEKGLYGKFKPVQPDQVLWQGKIIDITFDVNVGDLTLDTSLVSETHNYGFDIWNDKDELILDAIKSITVLADNRVRIVLNRAFSNHKLSYGRGRSTDPNHSGYQTGARGNLRDQAGDTDNYVLPNTSNRRYMHNWCVLFEYSQQFGFYEGLN